MWAVVVYESMYGNTHLIAEAVAAGLRERADVVVVPVDEADEAIAGGVDLLVVGGPTHAHGMSHVNTRKAAVEAATKPGKELDLDPDAEGEGLREWFGSLGPLSARAAAFDTRLHVPAAFSGRASKGIARRLERHGCERVAEPESFFVTNENRLEPDEESRAREWGARLGTTLVVR